MNLKNGLARRAQLDRATRTPRHHYFDTVKISLDDKSPAAYWYLDDVKINPVSNLW